MGEDHYRHDSRGPRRACCGRGPPPGDIEVRTDPPGSRLRPYSRAGPGRPGSVALAGRLRSRHHIHAAGRGRRRHLRPVKFADTGWGVAWGLPGEARHGDALGLLAALGTSEQVLTSNLVVGETWTFLRRRDSHRTAVAFLDRIDALIT